MASTFRTNTVEAFLQRKRLEGKRSNRLIDEKSPYLLQHAYNPVTWFPWGPEAFERARQEDKPIFLSVGYSTCYWCHVMEREVFENESIATRMNELVISIKVDREELPAVDRVYMSALMGMTGSGGWPISMFLTPDLKPFFGGTYIPPVSQYGRAGFVEILEKIHDQWSKNRQQFTEAGDRLVEFLRENSAVARDPIEVDVSVLDKGYEAFRLSYDTVHGGFGGAPKFPTPVNLSFLLRYHLRSGSSDALDMVVRTLDQMRDGGIWDHLGGGLHRYSTDATWHVPHFEKMLYDQALCATAFLEAFQITGSERFAESARAILDYVSRDLTDPEGGFWSAEDAESAPDASSPDVKREGAFYCWTKDKINEILTPGEVEVVERFYDVRSEGNVTSDPHGMFQRMNILHRTQGAEHIDRLRGVSAEQVAETLRTAEAKLLRHRGDRPRPGLDDKVLASWNGLMISALARASHVLKEPQYLTAAEKAGAFIFRTMWDPSGRSLLHRYRGGEARFPGLLEDYAFLIQALIDLYESSLNVQWLQWALDLTEEQIARFHDSGKGGFFDAHQDELSGIVRTKEGYDGATPSGNAVTILNLLRLSAMLHEGRYRSLARETLAVFGAQLSANPRGTAQFLIGLDRGLAVPRQVVIAGPKDDPKTHEILRLVHSHFDPCRSVVHVDGGEAQEYLVGRDPFFGSFGMIAGRPTAYVCRDFTCELPSSDIPTIAELLSRSAH